MPASLFARVRALFLFLLFAVTTAAQAAPPQRWTFVDLGSLAGQGSSAWAINNRGDIGGISTVSTALPFPIAHAFLWQNGTMTDVGTSIGNPPGVASSVISAINDRGLGVGTALDQVHVWEDGVPRSLGIAGYASDVNKFGAIVGTHQTGPFRFGGQYLGFVFQNGVMHTLGTLGGHESHAEAINDRGVVAGWSYTTPGTAATQAFIYRNGVMTALGTLGGRDSTARDINNHGVVVGMAEDAAGMPHGFIWDERGGMRSIAAGFSPMAINDRGAVVGMVSDTPYLYDDGKLTRLDTLAAVAAAQFSRMIVTNINDRGWIVGYGYKPGAYATSFLLMPR